MAKRVKKVTAQGNDAEMRRWCIEQALRWPMSVGSYPAHVQSVGGYVPTVEADVIGRAKRILDWVGAK